MKGGGGGGGGVESDGCEGFDSGGFGGSFMGNDAAASTAILSGAPGSVKRSEPEEHGQATISLRKLER